MNKMSKILISVIIVLVLTGCNNKTNSNLNNETNNNIDKSESLNNKNDIKNKYQKFEWKCDIGLSDIKDISGFKSMFITNDGKLYEFSLDRPFSNEKYCKKIDTDKRFVRFINGTIITDENKIYAYTDNNEFVERMSGWTGGFDYSLFDKYDNLILFSKFGINHDYAIVEDKEVSIIKYEIEHYPNTYTESIGFLNSDEEYIGGFYRILKTTKNYYVYGEINEEECNKYVDIKCEYGLKRVEEISNQYDNILYYNGKFIIFKDDLNNIYQV